MRRKIAFVLAVLLLSCRVNVLADTDGLKDNTQGGIDAIEIEAEAQSEENGSTSLENSVPSQKEEQILKEDSESEKEEQKTESLEIQKENQKTESLKLPEENQETETTELRENEQAETSKKEEEEISAGSYIEEDTKESIQESLQKEEKTSSEKSLPASEKDQTKESRETREFQPEKLLDMPRHTPAQLSRKELSLEEDMVYQVSFPADTRAFFDPGNLSGEGQIFSEHYEIENLGNTDVAVKIKSIEIYDEAEEGIYEFSETEITESLPKTKKVNIDMVWERENGTGKKILHVTQDISDEYVIELKAACYGKESRGYFYFTGTMNPNPNINWGEGSLRITFYYELISPEDTEKVMYEEDDLEIDLDDKVTICETVSAKKTDAANSQKGENGSTMPTENGKNEETEVTESERIKEDEFNESKTSTEKSEEEGAQNDSSKKEELNTDEPKKPEAEEETTPEEIKEKETEPKKTEHQEIEPLQQELSL